MAQKKKTAPTPSTTKAPSKTARRDKVVTNHVKKVLLIRPMVAPPRMVKESELDSLLRKP